MRYRIEQLDWPLCEGDWRACGAWATYVIWDSGNRQHGSFCAQCAVVAKARLERLEAAHEREAG